MRLALAALLAAVFTYPAAYGQQFTHESSGLTEAQMEPWNVLMEQLQIGNKRDFKAMKKYMHPKGIFWGDFGPAPLSMESYPYWDKTFALQGDIVATHVVPVSVVVVDDVAIINCYIHSVTEPDDGPQKEVIERLHNTWKKENGRWQLLAVYNTVVPTTEGR